METYNMAYSLETSSVKTIVPGAEVSGFADVVARQKISALSSEVPQLSAGEGIAVTTVDGKTVIKNNISAGSNISLVYDQETNTYRIDAASQDISAYTLTGADGIDVSTDHVNRQTVVTYTGTMGDTAVNNVVRSYSANGTWLTSHQSLSNYYQKTETSSKQQISAAIDYISSNAGITFPITGTNGTTGFTANMDCSSMMLTTGASPAGGYVKQTVRGVQYEAYPATDVSASWYNIINATNNRSNCYCIRFTNDMTAASLEDYSAYDKVTVVHSNEYTPDCMLYWDGNTKVFPSGLYCELVKGVNDQNQTDWFFTTSGWINNVEWDWD